MSAESSQAGRGLGKLLILTWSYSVKNLSKQWESTAKLSSAFLWVSHQGCFIFQSLTPLGVTDVYPDVRYILC